MALWHPDDEATATSGMAVFIEWLRANGRQEPVNPATVREWAGRDPAGFAAAIAGFAGLEECWGVRANLLRHTGAREALVLVRGGMRRAWSRDQLRANDPPLPADLTAAMAALRWSDLPDLAAHHLLEANTRPDRPFIWTGDISDKRLFGALLVGAAVILGDGIMPL